MDTRYDLQHTECPTPVSSAVMMAISGCPARTRAGYILCGMSITRSPSDFLDVGIDYGSLAWPRVLSEAKEIGGVAHEQITCQDPQVCKAQCANFAERARPGGLDIPAGCALCDAICPINILTTLGDAVEALAVDIATTVRLFLTCVGPGGPAACVCQIMMLLKPAWVENLPTNKMKCKGGDIFGLIVGKITDVVLNWVEQAVNGILDFIEPILCGLTWGGVCDIAPVCYTHTENVYRCKHAWGGDTLPWLLGCGFNDDVDEAKRCFFDRQRSICMEGDPSRYNRYQNLFEAPSTEELENEFFDIVGSSFSEIPPSLAAAFDNLQQESSNDLFTNAAKSLCDSGLWSSMDIDEIIVVCMFHYMESFCPVAPEEIQFDPFLKELRFELPKVVWDWSANPPPPPPRTTRNAIEQYTDADPEGVELVEAALAECFPALKYVGSMSQGSQVGHDRSPDGQGYGPVYSVNRYAMSAAFLSTEAWDNKDSLSARMVQARFSGMWRYSCK